MLLSNLAVFFLLYCLGYGYNSMYRTSHIHFMLIMFYGGSPLSCSNVQHSVRDNILNFSTLNISNFLFFPWNNRKCWQIKIIQNSRGFLKKKQKVMWEQVAGTLQLPELVRTASSHIPPPATLFSHFFYSIHSRHPPSSPRLKF